METRYSQHLREMERRVLEAPGSLDPAIRRSVVEGTPLDDPVVQAYVENVRLHAYTVTDLYVDELREAGWSEDQIFDLTVAAAYGAGRKRLDAGLSALEAALDGGEATIR
jgi:alkylhydroperoxidase family enzyme